MKAKLPTSPNGNNADLFQCVEVPVDPKNSHKLTYKLGEKERLRIFANLLIDMFLETQREKQLKMVA